jgi:BMFP domain-containing protein YqiC
MDRRKPDTRGDQRCARQFLHSRACIITSNETEVFEMSTGPNRILDEFAKLFTDAAGAAQGVRREVETAFKGQAEKILNSMDVVQREEFEAAREMAVKARAENKKLAARIDALEARIAEISGAAPGETAPAAASSRTKAKK